MYKPTRSDISVALGAALADILRSPDRDLQGLDVAVAAEAFVQATIKAAKPADRAVLREVTSDPETRNAWIAKAAAMCDRKWRVINAVCPDRSGPIMAAAGIAA